MGRKKIKIVVIGDVHELWNQFDQEALEFLGADLVLFVGDFGNESLTVVENIAKVPITKAVVLGNHDAWFTATEWGRKKSPYNHQVDNRVKQQLEILGSYHVGYGYMNFPELDISVVGSRPFSWGGSKWKCKEFYQEYYQIGNFEESVDKIMDSVSKTTCNHLIFIGHNGPFGLGSNPEDTCGRDWKPMGGDYGDPDFAEAINLSYQWGKKVPLVTFGHMHHNLRHTKERLRTIINRNSHNTIYLNSASTPRIQEIDGEKIHRFSVATLEGDKISSVNLIKISEKMEIKENTNLYDGYATNIS